MNTATIPMKGEQQARKKPPKLIEKVIEKVEEALTQPAEPVSTGEIKPKPRHEQKPQQNPEQTHVQGSLGGSSEYILPEGTTIKLPDGNEFETHTKSKISKVTRHKAGEEGGEV